MDVEANLQQVANSCTQLSGKTDLLILPEMFNTGYTMAPKKVPLDWQNKTMDALQEMSSKHNIVIGGSIPMYKEGEWYNTFIFVNENGLSFSYDKIHLFTLAGEKNEYQQGEKNEYFELNEWLIQSLICYDLRFPYLTFKDKSPDILIYSANWPEVRVKHWRSLLIARAVENQCYVVGVNRTGKDENGYQYSGNSMVIDYSGEILCEMDGQDGIHTQTLDKEAMSAFRKKLPFSQDRIFQ
jgi:predicted amidohydrolase